MEIIEPARRAIAAEIGRVGGNSGAFEQCGDACDRGVV
jgi:hypothetical protein